MGKFKDFLEKLKKIWNSFKNFLESKYLILLAINLILWGGTKNYEWASNLDGFTTLFFAIWLFLGVSTFQIIKNEYFTNYKQDSGKVLLNAGFLILVWAVLGSQVLNFGYWGTVADWFSGIWLVVLTAYLVKETSDQRKGMEKQLNIMSKQLEMEYEPIILFDFFKFSLYTQTKPEIEDDFSVIKISMDTLSEGQLLFRPLIKNVGKFPARNLTINYIFDYKNFQKDILELNEKLGNPLKIEISKPISDISLPELQLSDMQLKKIITLPSGHYEINLPHLENGSKSGVECSAFFYSIYYNTWLILKTIEFVKSAKPHEIIDLTLPKHKLSLEMEYMDNLNYHYEIKADLYSGANGSYEYLGLNKEYNISGFWRFNVVSYEKKNKIQDE
ncbi:hypothetical protein HNP92_000269 [Methanococcus maripaludis]|uniref:Uncharacterized protein n=1 Tax=Methanococcus maripaludis TaxID=39152 RepID=A0A7J9S585_METMI|nr:hypothetical protein [Methanococcus maripaludis]MBB6400984.1 hypothetical protein [Methanococcus maripaludis]